MKNPYRWQTFAPTTGEDRMPYLSKPRSRWTAYRPIIAALIRALCAVPKEARREWIDELMTGGPTTDAVSPDDLVVRQVLVNLDVAEDVANARREEERPKPYPIVGREVARRSTDRGKRKAAPFPAASMRATDT